MMLTGQATSILTPTEGVPPEEVVVIAFSGRDWKKTLAQLQKALRAVNVRSLIPGLVAGPEQFGTKGSVTLTNAFSAKGNEAALVYILSFEELYRYADAFENRNKAFTSISRSKAWVRISGVGDRMEAAKREVDAILSDAPYLRFTFPAADYQLLDSVESVRRKKASREAARLTQALTSIDPGAIADMDPELRARLLLMLRPETD